MRASAYKVVHRLMFCNLSSPLLQDPRKLLYNRTVVDVVARPIDKLSTLNELVSPPSSLMAWCQDLKLVFEAAGSFGHGNTRIHALSGRLQHFAASAKSQQSHEAAGSYKGHEILEQFIRRCNHYAAPTNCESGRAAGGRVQSKGLSVLGGCLLKRHWLQSLRNLVGAISTLATLLLMSRQG